MLVVVWATVAVWGGAIYIANHADSPGGNAPLKAGLGLCAVSVAMFVGKAARRIKVQPLMAALRPILIPPCPLCWLLRAPLYGPPATGPPIFILLQVSRK